MSIRKLVRPTNGRIRLAVGLGLLALICIQCVNPTEAVRETDLFGSARIDTASEPVAQRLETLAATDPIALLTLCIKHYDKTIGDYTCTFIKRERIQGKDGASQEIRVKFLDRPFSVAMRWVKNAPIGDRCLFVEGKHDGNVLIRPKGLLSLIGTVKRKPDSNAVMANTLRPISLFGFRRGLQSLLDVYELAASRGDLKTSFGGYRSVAGRNTLVLERLLPARDDYPAKKTRIYIDLELLVPVCIEAWDWDGNLESRYIYKDIKVNTGLSADDFTPQANGL